MRLAALAQIVLLALSATQSTASPLATHALEKRSYMGTCGFCSLRFPDGATNPVLGCYCRKRDGSMNWSELPLNKCLANRNGKLAWAVKLVLHILESRNPFLLTIIPLSIAGTLEEAVGSLTF
jgi:hypothetical protein